MIDEKIAEKLRKLLRFAEDAEKRSSQAELENAMAKVQDILTKYNIDLNQINLKENKEEPITENRTSDNLNPKNEGKWLVELYWKISKYFFVMCVSNSKQTQMTIFGESHNIQIFEYVIEMVKPMIKKLGKEAWSKYNGDITNRNAFLRAFYSGAVTGLRNKLEIELAQSRVSNIPEEHAMAVVLQDKITKIESYVHSNYSTTTKSKASRYSAAEAKALGVQAGGSINLRKGLNTSSTGGKLLS